MFRMSLRASVAACGFLFAAALPAHAWDWWAPAGTPPVSAPGRLDLALGAEAVSVRLQRFRYGDRFADSGFDPSLGPVYDERKRRIGAMPQIQGSYGLPDGLLGMPAEAFARFAYYRASAEFGGNFVRTGLPTVIFPFVGTLTLPGSGYVLSGIDIESPIAVSVRQSLASYDGGIGLRVQRVYGGWTFSPSAEFGFQRLALRDRIDLAVDKSGDPSITGGPTRADIDADYYRFGLGLTASRPLDPQWTWFGSVHASLDVIHARLSGSSTFTRYDGMFGFFETGSVGASASRSTVSGRVAVRSGLALAVTQNVRIVFAGGLQYLGAAPYVIYPTHANFDAGSHHGASTPIRIGFAGQLNYSAGIGAVVRF